MSNWGKDLALVETIKAIKDGDEEKIKSLMPRVDIENRKNEKLCGDETLLSLAVNKRLVSMVKCLLAYDVDIKSVNSKGLTPLHCVSNMGQFSEIHSVSKKPYYQTFADSLTIIEMLLKQGASVNARDNSGKTPLHYAASLDIFRPEIIKTLLVHGAEVNAACNDDLTPIFYVKNIKILWYFIEKGANIDYVSRTAFTPLCNAIKLHNPMIAEVLLESGANVNILNSEGQGLMEIVSVYSNFKILEIIANRVEDINNLFRELVQRGLDKHDMIPIIMKRIVSGQVHINLEYFQAFTRPLLTKCIKCTTEIIKLKDTKLGFRELTLFDVLLMNVKKLADIADNQNLLEILEKLRNKSDTDFPVYRQMLKRHIEKAVSRRRLIDSSVKVFKKMIFYYLELKLSDMIVYKIVSLVNNMDLRNVAQMQ